MVRKDLTISLDEEQISELLEIAEKQQITLSALIRDIISLFFTSIKQGTAPDFSGVIQTTLSDLLPGSSPSDLAGTVARHDKLLADLQMRVLALENSRSHSFQTPLTASGPDIMSLTSPVPSIPGSVIDCDLQPHGFLSDDALVKMPRQQVAPVMDAMEMGSMRVRADKEYSQTESAVALNVSVSTMRKYIKEEKIPARKVGRSWLIHGRDILTYLAQNS